MEATKACTVGVIQKREEEREREGARENQINCTKCPRGLLNATVCGDNATNIASLADCITTTHSTDGVN